MNKNIIIAILVVVIIALAAFFVLGQSNGKMDTEINIINNETFQNGEIVQFELKDSQGNALSGQTVNITFNNEKYTVTTDQNGKGYLTISDMASGKYDLEVSYAGDDKYNGCDSKDTITVDAESAADQPTQQTNSDATAVPGQSSPHPGCTYIAKLGVWVDANGIIVATNGEDTGVGMTVQEYEDFLERANSGWDPENPNATAN